VIDPKRQRTFLYYLMEYVDGTTLAEWRASREDVEIREVTDLIEQIAQGLQAFFRREMLHQDVKPPNILVGREGRVRIVDFGSCWVAGIREIAAPIERDVALGTAQYSAPETRSGETAGVPSEVFSLATVAYELLTGALPFGDAIEAVQTPKDFERLSYKPSYEHDPLIPVWLDGALRKALAPRPADRYREVSELVYDLRHPNPKLLGRWRPRPHGSQEIGWWKRAVGVLLVLQALTIGLLIFG
ncbi:MAG: serine/threonine-protein kinase, partial [Candidatus Binatia bacterium]|nr:serine/threonine-protein kinase [Candidatus Binatia bacterium]